MVENLFNSRTLVIIDAGHGIDTPGKRSPVWKDGTQLFEWEFNRAVTAKIIKYLSASLISNVNLINTDNDIPLKTRSNTVNDIYRKYKDKFFVYLVSIHGNAAEDSRASGIEAFTTTGITVCDTLADMHLEELKTLGWRMRTQNTSKLNKDLDFWILKQTECPSVLTESGFYTNEEECKKMMDRYWRNQIAMAHIRAVVKIEFNKTITYGT